MSEVKNERKYLSEEGLRLLYLAQNGDTIAEEDLIILVKTQFMGRRIGRYLGRNRQVENDDVKQEFLIGIAESIPKARLDMGDPIEFIISRGIYRVRGYMRKHIKQGTMQTCSDCGHKTRINMVNGRYECKRCGSINIETFEVNNHNDLLLDNMMVDGFEEEVTSDIILEDFEKTLTPGTNVHSLYTLLKSGIDRDNKAIKNYIKEVAKIWGGCSDQNVVRNLEKLRDKMRKYIIDNNVETYIRMVI